MKLTFGTVKAACAKVLNMNQDDPRVLETVNRACERLLYDSGKSVDTLVRYSVCVTDGCLTWPREIETIEAWGQCGCPGTVRNSFYEFLGYGPGGMSPNNGYSGQLIDRGNAVAFSDVIGTGKKLAIWSDSVEDAGLKMLVRYYDGNANKVYTSVDCATLDQISQESDDDSSGCGNQVYIDRDPLPPDNPTCAAINVRSDGGSWTRWDPASASWG